MSDQKTKPIEASVEEFINALDDGKKKDDSFRIIEIMKDITGEPAKMWGSSIIGFGAYHYKYESGREVNSFLTGFSPRKANISLYIMSGFSEYKDLINQLGKYKTGKSCLYIKKLEDIDEGILRQLIQESVEYMKKSYHI